MALYQNIRPATFDEILGNTAAVEALKINLAKPPADRPHVYGLVGPSGCGKTTLARICATVLGANPLSIREINASDTRGIDTVREIADQMKFTTMDGTPQVWILDECHKFTSDAWNCLLKPLEDTPKHVYVFLCTTEANKIPKAAQTRTKILTVEPQKEADLIKWLAKTAHKLGTPIARPLLELIAENSSGSPRQALQHLESVTGVADEATARKIILQGTVEDEGVANLAGLLIKKSQWKTIADQLKLLKAGDAEGIRRSVQGYCNAILLNGRADDNIAAVLEIFSSTNCFDGLPVLTVLCYQAHKAVQEA